MRCCKISDGGAANGQCFPLPATMVVVQFREGEIRNEPEDGILTDIKENQKNNRNGRKKNQGQMICLQ